MESRPSRSGLPSHQPKGSAFLFTADLEGLLSHGLHTAAMSYTQHGQTTEPAFMYVGAYAHSRDTTLHAVFASAKDRGCALPHSDECSYSHHHAQCMVS